MGRVVHVDRNNVYILLKGGKTIKKSLESLSFDPTVGDEVEVKQCGDKVIILRPYLGNIIFDFFEKIGAKKEKAPKKDEYYTLRDDLGDGEFFQKRIKDLFVFGRGVKVHKTIYVFLSLCFGPFALHKFYSRKILQAILYLLITFVIPDIGPYITFGLSLRDTYLMLIKKPDKSGYVVI